MKKKKNYFFYQIMTSPSITHTQWTKSWGLKDFKMAANENALTQPKFDVGITGIKQHGYLHPSK